MKSTKVGKGNMNTREFSLRDYIHAKYEGWIPSDYPERKDFQKAGTITNRDDRKAAIDRLRNKQKNVAREWMKLQ